jgi:hypothetical protein
LPSKVVLSEIVYIPAGRYFDKEIADPLEWFDSMGTRGRNFEGGRIHPHLRRNYKAMRTTYATSTLLSLGESAMDMERRNGKGSDTL